MHGKISSSMYSGSMVGAGSMAFALMPYCIANARPDEDSTVDLNPQVLAAIFGESKATVEAAITYLCSPDPLSRSKECDGRRLVHVGPGPFRYKVVNLQRYRDDLASDERREYWKQHKAWERAGKPGEFVFKPVVSTVSTGKSVDCPQGVHATDAGTDAGTETSLGTHTHPVPKSKVMSPDDRVCVEKCDRPDPKDLARDLAAQKRPENGFTVFDLKASLCLLYNRQPEAPWAYEEERLAVSIAKRPECRKELAEINQFRAGLAEKKYFPNKLMRLLEDWTGTLDRARAGKNGIGPKLADVIAFVKEKCPLDDRAAGWGASFHAFWSKRGWAVKGLPIDWKLALSKQVATWGKEA